MLPELSAPIIKYTDPVETSPSGGPSDEQRLLAFQKDFSTLWTLDRKADLVRFYTQWYGQYVNSRNQMPEKTLVATGEHPIFTSLDALQGEPTKLPDEVVGNALAKRHFHLWVLTHPTILHFYRSETKNKYKPISGKSIPVIDEFRARHETITFEDLGFEIPDPYSFADEHNVDVGNLPDGAREIMAKGLFSWVSDQTLAFPYNLASTPDVVSAMSLATMAIAGAVGYAPMDGIWNIKDNQKIMLERAVEFIENDPFIMSHPEREFLIMRAKELLGVTIKSSPKDVAETLGFFRGLVRRGRIYDPRAMERLAVAVQTARDAGYDDFDLTGGPVAGVVQAQRIARAGANATSVGIMEGTVCDTQDVASLAPNNLYTLYDIARAGLAIPTFADGGINKIPVAIGVGGSSVMRSSMIGNGIEKPPLFQWHDLGKGKWGSNLSGEAGGRTKKLGGKVDAWGDPVFVEGTDRFTVLNPDKPSIASNIYHLNQRIATSVLFNRAESVKQLQHEPRPGLVYLHSNSTFDNRSRNDFRSNGGK